jgi:hypothetical protein
MDLSALAVSLLDKHQAKTQHLTTLIRSTARTHYANGVKDTLRIMQEAAVSDEAMKHELTVPAAEGRQLDTGYNEAQAGEANVLAPEGAADAEIRT